LKINGNDDDDACKNRWLRRMSPAKGEMIEAALEQVYSIHTDEISIAM